MDYQTKPQFEELALTKRCTVDCSSCPTFPAPVRRVGELLPSRFDKLAFNNGEGFRFSSPEEAGIMSRLLFVISGSVELSLSHEGSRTVASGQGVCLAEACEVTACDGETSVIVLSIDRSMEFCESDIFGGEPPHDLLIRRDAAPVLSLHPAIVQMAGSLFAVPELCGCTRYHGLKSVELVMLMRQLYSPAELAYFFQSMVHPHANFRVFVHNNYDKAQGVGQLAALAGMSLSVFKRRFAEHFNDSVYHWMMQQKAHKIHNDIRDGADSTKALMAKYGFRHHTQFSRFCKNYLQATPAQLIATTKSRKRGH